MFTPIPTCSFCELNYKVTAIYYDSKSEKNQANLFVLFWGGIRKTQSFKIEKKSLLAYQNVFGHGLLSWLFEISAM